ncbi:LANO_0D10968g1_1 [Lachancea nothofagi CBS 11611]|uniref:LANO_0D10968g1_1 n=1 Tax=Lachancea nothofagi CBS 11611 TaxID=1266666 RepID=A0A1G4JKV5_9SACH|nr:LANO_0D10968g1_1 [Lachancea nothofagi CBS 11611]
MKFELESGKMTEIEIPVLVLGGSLVGLSAGIFLANSGVPNIIVEKHLGSMPHPRAMGYTAHTMEFFRCVGLADKIPQVKSDTRIRRAKVTSLFGEWQGETSWGGKPDVPKPDTPKPANPSPCNGAAIPQDKLEPILRERALELGCKILQHTLFLGLQQNESGIVAIVRDRSNNHTYKILAQYMIAADGAKSAVREALQIPRKGRGYIQTLTSVLFRCPQADEVLSKGVVQFEIDQPNLKAFMTTYSDGRWALMFRDNVERTQEQLLEAAKQAVGHENAHIDLITTAKWDLSALVCEYYSKGRVFLAGDSAHALPPTRGGYGANTGIDDVHNLAWKLKLVLEQKASKSLLDTYSIERQPIGWLRHQQTFARPDYAAQSQGIAANERIIDDAGMELGQLHTSKAICGADVVDIAAQKPDLWKGQPGVRAPHSWVSKRGEVLSTIDLFNKNFVVLSENEEWLEATQHVAQQLDIEIDFVLAGKDIVFAKASDFQEIFGIDRYGASLVRPDGIVGWRSKRKATRPSKALIEAFNQILHL